VLQRDVRDLAQIEGISQLPNLLEILATRAGGLLNAADISRSASMPNTTINRYINLLKTLYLVNFLQPWSSKRSKRLVKSSKTYLVDTGLLVYLLKIDPNGLKVDSTARGSIVENFVVMELLKQTSWHTKRTQLFHYRTLTGLETDLVLEDSSGNAACIEIKSRETVTSNDFKGIKLVKEELGEKCKAGVVLYTGTEKIPFGHNLWALPISCLWT
jgi:predicted AAA+ superfamily ATPase